MVQLDRDFQAMIDRSGRILLGHSERLFDWWHRVRDGTMARTTLRYYVERLRSWSRADLHRSRECGSAGTAGTCRVLLVVETHL